RLLSRLSDLPALVAGTRRGLPSFPTRRSSDLPPWLRLFGGLERARGPNRVGAQQRLHWCHGPRLSLRGEGRYHGGDRQHHHRSRSEEHTSELQSRENLVCRLLLEKKKIQTKPE